MRRAPSNVLDVSPTGRNGHHRGEREFARSRPVPGQTPPNSTWETRTLRSARKGGQRRAERLLQWALHRKASGSPEGIWAARKGCWTPASEFLETLSFWNTVGLLQWNTSRRAKRAQSTASSRKRKDLTPKSEASNFEGLPRTPVERPADGARPNLENSTACQKSMPITSSRGGCVAWSLWAWSCGHFERKSFGWTMNDQYFCWLFDFSLCDNPSRVSVSCPALCGVWS